PPGWDSVEGLSPRPPTAGQPPLGDPGRIHRAPPVGATPLRRSSALLLLLAQAGDDGEVLEGAGVAGDGPAGGHVAEEPPHDLPAAGLRERVREADVGGARELPDRLLDVGPDALLDRVGG